MYGVLWCRWSSTSLVSQHVSSLLYNESFSVVLCGGIHFWCSNNWYCVKSSLRQQSSTPPLVRNKRINSILMTRRYPDLASASDWSCRERRLVQPIRSTAQILVVTRHQYGIFPLVSMTSFRGETGSGVTKCWLLTLATCKWREDYE